jgi:hypothetical protein
MADDLVNRLQTLDNNLADFKATDQASWALGKIFNALLDAAQKANPGDVVLEAIEPAEQGTVMGVPAGENSNMNVGTMRAAIGQILGVLD